VTVNVTLLGGGFGRKSKCDYVLEAALLSKELGAPVKVQWTREDDVRHDFLHTVSVERIEAGLDKSGKVIAWRHRSVAPTIASTFEPNAVHEAPFELGMGLIDMPFENRQHQLRESGSGGAYPDRLVPLGVEHPRAFAVQSMVGELATATNRDQKEMLLELIGSPRIVNLASVKDPWNYGEPYDSYPIDTGRLRRVVELVAEKGGWGRTVPKGTRARHCRASQLRQLHRDHCRGVGRREGQAHGAPGRHRDRLWNLCQSRAHPVADRGRRDSWG